MTERDPTEVLAAMRRELHGRDPRVVLVGTRVMRRVLKRHRRLHGFASRAPHQMVYAIDRSALLDIVEPRDLGCALRDLQPVVILVREPTPNEIKSGSDAQLYTDLWRRLFHADIDLQYAEMVATDTLDYASTRVRIERLGEGVFDEIRWVLDDEHRLLPPVSDATVFAEFAALYLELTHFQPSLVPRYFPALDSDIVDKILAEDIDVAAALQRTRPPSAPERPDEAFDASKVPATEDGLFQPPTSYRGNPARLLIAAAAESELRNDAKAAVHAAQASWCSTTDDEREGAEQHVKRALQRLAERLVTTLGVVGDPLLEGLPPENQRRDTIFRKALRLVAKAREAPRKPTPGDQIPGDASPDDQIPEEQARTELGTPSEDQEQEPGGDTPTPDVNVEDSAAEAAALLDGEPPDDLSRNLEIQHWVSVLEPLVAPAAAESWPVEERLLYDLQRVCDNSERRVFKVDVLRWLRGRSIRRPLPSFRRMQTAKFLRSAKKRVGKIRASDAARGALLLQLRRVLRKVEDNLRREFRPILEQVLDDVGLHAENLPMKVARHKAVEELLDLALERGYLTMGNLRDRIAGGHLKLPVVNDASTLIFGDPLLRANRALRKPLDGVYRPAEFYMRWLQRLSAVGFGSRPGRWVMLYLLFPFGGAAVALEGLTHVVGPLMELTVGIHPHLLTPSSFLLVGILFFTLIHSALARIFTKMLLQGLWRFTVWLLFDVPRGLYNLAWVQRLVLGRWWITARQAIVKPAIAAGVYLLFIKLTPMRVETSLYSGLAVFGGFSFALNSRLGRAFEDRFAESAGSVWARIRHQILPGMFRMIIETFRWMVESVERLTYAVDEWFRFRQGDARLSIAIKGIFGPIWYAITYVIRFYFTVLIEPQVNPVKHFPAVTVAAKLYIPFIGPMASGLTALLQPVLGGFAGAVAGTTVALFPGIAGFLAWELTANWRLFETNRPNKIKPVRVGSHGETMARFLRPGFHSGTLPKLYLKMRRAERKGKLATLGKLKHDLHHVEERVHNFVERDLIEVFLLSRRLRDLEISVGAIHLGSHHIRIELAAEALGPDALCAEPAALVFEEHSRWLLAYVEAGWMAELRGEAHEAMRDAITGFFKLCGVDLLRQRVEAIIPEGSAYEITARGLVVWPYGRYTQMSVYPLDIEDWELYAHPPHDDLYPILPDELFFRCRPVGWNRWLEVWEEKTPPPPMPRGEVERVQLVPKRARPAAS